MAPRQAAWPQAIGAVTRWRDAARVGLEASLAAARGTHFAAAHAKQAVSERADAASDAAAKVAHAPAEVAREVRKELDAWWRGVAKTLAGAVVVGVLGLFALIIVTMGAVVLLNALLGDPYGTLAVGALYLVGALLGVRWMKRSKKETQAEADAPAELTVDPTPQLPSERQAL
ncbi:MAG TPA: hypothetical protein VFH78_06085 [Candidatus Thermoplasmatota archaeon]|nr:hypothetical protein [Candidatus Thermoplasmatota archaeon]